MYCINFMLIRLFILRWQFLLLELTVRSNSLHLSRQNFNMLTRDRLTGTEAYFWNYIPGSCPFPIWKKWFPVHVRFPLKRSFRINWDHCMIYRFSYIIFYKNDVSTVFEESCFLWSKNPHWASCTEEVNCTRRLLFVIPPKWAACYK